jgi:hypothetical protein
MKKGAAPLSVKKSPKTEQKSSGITSRKPPSVAAKSRKDKDIPADRGAYEKESLVQGSE